MKLVYKFGAALLAVIIIAVVIFTPLVYVSIESIAAQLLVGLGQATGNDYADALVGENGKLPDHVGIPFSVSTLFSDDAEITSELIKVFSDGSTSIENIRPLIAPVITFAVSLAVLVLCALVIIVLAFVVKDNRKVIYAAIAGLGLSLIVPESFEAVADPFLNGEVTLATLAGSSWISLLGEFDDFELLSNFWFIPLLFGVVILWTVLYNYTLPEADKKKRREMIEELDK